MFVLAVSWPPCFSPVTGGMGDTLIPGDLVPTDVLALHSEPWRVALGSQDAPHS